MATPKFGTVQGQSSLSADPYYIGLVQHENSMTKKETYEHLKEKLKFSGANIKAAFLGLAKVLKQNANKGNDAIMDGIAHFKIYAKGSVAGSTGPWVKGVNTLVINALEQDAFKNAMGDTVPQNVTEGLVPEITTVLDTVTGEYDVITGTDLVSIGGRNLGPDVTKSDEGAYVLFDDGTTIPLAITSSSVTLVTAKFASAPSKTGKCKVVVATRCGMGEEFGVKTATRIVTIG